MNKQVISKLRQSAIIIQIAAFVLSFISLIYVANFGNMIPKVPEEYKPALICLIIGLLFQIGSIIMNVYEIKYSNYMRLIVAVMITLAMSLFASGSVLSVVDKIYNIVMWGDATQFPKIIGFGVCLLLGTIADIVVCWLN